MRPKRTSGAATGMPKVKNTIAGCKNILVRQNIKTSAPIIYNLRSLGIICAVDTEYLCIRSFISLENRDDILIDKNLATLFFCSDTVSHNLSSRWSCKFLKIENCWKTYTPYAVKLGFSVLKWRHACSGLSYICNYAVVQLFT